MSVIRWAWLLLFAFSCGPVCSEKSFAPQRVCSEDPGAITAGAPFVLMATTSLATASCAVVVDGGQLNLVIAGFACGGKGSGSAKPALPQPVRCEVPALPEGTYTVNSDSPFSFTLPDAGIPPCL